MSTKIYNGKIIKNMSVFELNEFRKALRKEMIPVAQEQYYKMMAHIMQTAYVMHVTGVNICKYSVELREHDGTPIDIKRIGRKAADDLVTKTSNAVFTYDSEDDADYDVNVCVFPLENKMLAIYYAHNDELYSILKANPAFSDYGYWNNTDKPDDVSEEEWEQRKIDWDNALPGCGVPRVAGITLDIISSKYDINRYVDDFAHVSKWFKSDEEIIHAVAKQKAMDEEWTRQMEAAGFPKDKKIDNMVNVPVMKILRKTEEALAAHPEVVENYKKDMVGKINTMEFFAE